MENINLNDLYFDWAARCLNIRTPISFVAMEALVSKSVLSRYKSSKDIYIPEIAAMKKIIDKIGFEQALKMHKDSGLFSSTNQKANGRLRVFFLMEEQLRKLEAKKKKNAPTKA